MEYTRWYDKDEDLRNLMQMMQRLPENIQVEIAHDIIQVIIELNPQNSDQYLNDLSKNVPQNFKRWYDKDFSVHGAIEMIRALEPDSRDLLITHLSGSIIQILAAANKDEKSSD